MGYDNDSYNFGPFVPLMHLLLSKVTIPLQRVSSGERLPFCAWPKLLVQVASPGAFSSGWEDRIRAAETAVPGSGTSTSKESCSESRAGGITMATFQRNDPEGDIAAALTSIRNLCWLLRPSVQKSEIFRRMVSLFNQNSL
jgi:hypothetical protein